MTRQTKPSARVAKAWTLSGLDARLNLRKRGRDDGLREHPAPDALDLSDAERAVLEALARDREDLADERAQVQAWLDERLSSSNWRQPDFSSVALEAKLALKQIETRFASDWAQADERTMRARGYLEAFKQRNRLEREPFIRHAPVLQAGLLLCAAVAESLFSAALFAEEDARGLLGGAITAIGLSAANVSLGFLSGYVGLRYLQHRSAALKSAGALAFAAFGFLALALNLFAADWRDMLARASGSAGAQTSDASFHLWSVLNLDSPQAIILLMLGGGVWAFSTLKGYASFDDPYPDYGKMARAAESAREEFGELRAEAQALLEAEVRQARERASAYLEKTHTDVRKIEDAFDEGARDLQALDARGRALDEALNGAFKLYRDENRSARTSPTPAYFSAGRESVGESNALDVTVDAMAKGARAIEAARGMEAAAKGAYAGALNEIQVAFEDTLGRLEARAQS